VRKFGIIKINEKNRKNKASFLFFERHIKISKTAITDKPFTIVNILNCGVIESFDSINATEK
jgi:hypothetical protein